jgi:hypothetical protein
VVQQAMTPPADLRQRLPNMNIVNVHFHVASWIRDVELTLCKKHEKESMISIISYFGSVYQMRRGL